MARLADMTVYAVYDTDKVKHKQVKCVLDKCDNGSCSCNSQKSGHHCLLFKVISDKPDTKGEILFERHLNPEQFGGTIRYQMGRHVSFLGVRRIMTILDQEHTFHIRCKDTPSDVIKLQTIQTMLNESCSPSHRFDVQLVKDKPAALHFTQYRGTISLNTNKFVKFHKTFLIQNLEKCIVNVTPLASDHVSREHVAVGNHVTLLLFVKGGRTVEDTPGGKCEIIRFQQNRETSINVAKFVRSTYTHVQTVTAWQLQLELYPDHLLNVTVKFENETITILYYTKRVPVVIQRTEICACSLRSNERPGVTHDRGTRNRVTRNKATQKRVTLDYDVMQEVSKVERESRCARVKKSVVFVTSESTAELLVQFVKSYAYEDITIHIEVPKDSRSKVLDEQPRNSHIAEFLEAQRRGQFGEEEDTLNLPPADRAELCYELLILDGWRKLGDQLGLNFRELIIIESNIRPHLSINAADAVLMYWQYLHNRNSNKIAYLCNMTSLRTILEDMQREDLLERFFAPTAR